MNSFTIFTIAVILAAVAAMAYVFSSLRQLDDSVTRLQERDKALDRSPIIASKPLHPLARKSDKPSTKPPT